MGEILIKDGVRYTTHKYANEDELEKMVIEHYEDVFGKDSIFLTKQKIETRSGIGTIPDGFVLSMDDNKWYIIEVELDSHPLYEHIVPQITKFNTAMKNPSSKKRMVKAFYDEIKEDPTKSSKVQDKNIKELFKFISETLDTNPEIIIAINSKTGEPDEVCESLPFSSKIVEFKTFEREDAPLDHVHLFEPLYKKPFEPSKKQIPEKLPPQDFEVFKGVKITKDIILKSANNPVIKKYTFRTIYAVIDNKKYAVKGLIYLATQNELKSKDFTSVQAIGWLKKLGFKVIHEEKWDGKDHRSGEFV